MHPNFKMEDQIKILKAKFPLEYINSNFDKLNSTKVLVIGDTILDQYSWVLPKGRAVKDPILSMHFEYEEIYGGGAIIAVCPDSSDKVIEGMKNAGYQTIATEIG